ncbi:hypothetical protein HDV00_006862 [Rhizophlyctis rosea]|nr:hypothetical protein HDV00_006862 [Rhizophlyctis rosea]
MCNKTLVLILTLLALTRTPTTASPLPHDDMYHTDEHSPREAAPLARALVESSKIAEVATIADESVVPGVGGFPFSTPEYITDGCPSTGEPLVYLVSWGTHARNLAKNPSASFSFRSQNFTLPPPDSRTPLDEARMTLIGPLHRLSDATEIEAARKCFEQRHEDGFKWFPHRSAFFRMEVRKVRWIGGFGDRHFNGWIGREVYLEAGKAGTQAAYRDGGIKVQDSS